MLSVWGGHLDRLSECSDHMWRDAEIMLLRQQPLEGADSGTIRLYCRRAWRSNANPLRA